MKKILLLLLGVAIVVAAMVAVAPAGAVPAPKYFVCKYVGTPGPDERLQTGQNPISVSGNAINENPVVVGSSFADAQGRSYVIAEDTGQPKPSCPGIPEDEDELVSAGVQFSNATCETPQGFGFTGSNLDKIDYSIKSGSVGAGQAIVIQAEAKDGFTLGEGTKEFSFTFGSAPSGCEPGSLATGASFTEATCSAAPSVQLVKTNIVGLGLRPFYNVDGPAFVDGHPVAGGTYTFEAIPVEGFTFDGQSEFTHTFAAAPTDCGGTPHVVVGSASATCDIGSQTYKLSGLIDGQTADKVDPATLPGNSKGVFNVTVTRGDTSNRTTVSLNGDCAVPVAVVTPAQPPAAKPPVVKPKPPVVKPKPVKKPVKKHVIKKHKKVVKKVIHKPSVPKKAPKTL